MKVLLIEDNLEMRENTAEILELAGHEVVTAENGKVGVRKAQEFVPEIIVCDIMMPELDGYGTLHILSKNSTTSAIPFIFLTAKSEKEDFRKGMKLGADDYLTKPFEESELLEAIELRAKKSKMAAEFFADDAQDLESIMLKTSQFLDLDHLQGVCKSKKIKAKQVLFYEGDDPHWLYQIVSGSFKSYKMNEDGKELIINIDAKGAYLGYEQILSDQSFAHTSEALEDSEVKLIPKSDFLDLIQSNRDISKNFLKMLSSQVAEREQELIDLAYNTVRKRVADALITLNEKLETTLIQVSREDLAQMAGTSRESTIRMLSEFKSEGLIEIQNRSIVIKLLQQLKKIQY